MQNTIDAIENLVNQINKADSIEKLHSLEKVCELDITEREILKSEFFIKKMLLKKLFMKLFNKAEKKLKKQNYKYNINLNKVLSRNIYQPNSLNKLLLKSINRNIGAIPFVFLKNVENKNKIANKIFEIFTKYSFELLFYCLQCQIPTV